MAAPDPAATLQNKDALRRFYQGRDPQRLKNVDALFLRFDDDTIYEALKTKYGAAPPGWTGEEEDAEDSVMPDASVGRSMGSIVERQKLRQSKRIEAALPPTELGDSSSDEDEAPGGTMKKRKSLAQTLNIAPVKPDAPAISATKPPSPQGAAVVASPPIGKKTSIFGSLFGSGSAAEKPSSGRKLTQSGEPTRPPPGTSIESSNPKFVPPLSTVSETTEAGKTPEASAAKPPPPAPPPKRDTTVAAKPSPPAPPPKRETVAAAKEAPTPPPRKPSIKPPELQASPPAAAPAPAAAAPAVTFARPPKGSDALAKYEKMAKMLPQGAVELAMIRDGIHPAALFDDPMNDPEKTPKPNIAKPAAPPAQSESKPPPPSAPPPSSKEMPKAPSGMSLMEEIKWKNEQKEKMAASGGGGGSSAPAKKPDPVPGKKDDEKKSEEKGGNSLAARQAMLANMMAGKAGGGGGSAKPAAAPAAKKWATVDTSGSGGAASSDAAAALAAKLAPAASAGGDNSTPPDLAKYEKMAKMLPQGAVENAMTRDGVDPGWLFGADCITVKSDKRPVKGGGAGAPAPAAAAPAPAPAANQSPPKQQPQPQQQQQQQQQQYAPQSSQQSYGAPQQSYGAPQPSYGAPQGSVPQQQYSAPQTMGVWQQVWSPQHNAMYYLNSQTNQATWIAPPGFSAPAPAASTPQFVAVVRMIYPFSPTGANPLEISAVVGDHIDVVQFGNDGWIVGRNQRTGQQGLVPQNYSELVR